MSTDEPLGSPVPPRNAAPSPPVPEEKPPPRVPSLPARLLGVLTSPGATFKIISLRPMWAGALAVYLVLGAGAAAAYSLNTDWESATRNQFEQSLAFKLISSLVSGDELENIERAALNEVTSMGTGGLAMRTTLQVAFGTLVGFHFMLVLFVTLFYLMGALADMKLGRVYLDGLLCFLLLVLFMLVYSFIQGMFAERSLAALPYQAGLAALAFIGYFWLLHRSIERQPDFKRMAGVSAHAMAVPAVGALALIAIALLKSEPLTVSIDQVVTSSVGGILGQTQGVAGVLLGALDLFTLWGLTVMAIGFSAASRLSLGTSAAITFLPWGFYTMARLALAAAFA